MHSGSVPRGLSGLQANRQHTTAVKLRYRSDTEPKHEGVSPTVLAAPSRTGSDQRRQPSKFDLGQGGIWIAQHHAIVERPVDPWLMV